MLETSTRILPLISTSPTTAPSISIITADHLTLRNHHHCGATSGSHHHCDATSGSHHHRVATDFLIFCPNSTKKHYLGILINLHYGMQTLGEHKLPHFFHYPPYFTLQPQRETREKQIQLWKDLILDYCRQQKIFIIGLEEDFPLFSNPAIERSLNHEAREAFLSAIVLDGRAEWMDKSHRQCLILWHRIKDWADIILNFVKENGLEDSVMTVEEIRTGIESRGTDIHGMDRGVLMRALKLLENKGKLAIFKGTSTDDEGVKFSV